MAPPVWGDKILSRGWLPERFGVNNIGDRFQNSLVVNPGTASRASGEGLGRVQKISLG
jgi:hypothetical protein